MVASNPPTLSRTAYQFLGAICLSVIGTSFGLLGATGATTAAGGVTRGALYTGIFMATTLLATALGTPYGPLICARSSVRMAFATVQAVNALAYLAAGVALLAGAPTMPTLLVAAAFFGATAGLSGVVRPLVSKSYQSSNSTAHSYARLSVALGLAWGFGGLIGGVTLTNVAFAWGLVVNALLTAPLVVIVACVAPTSEPPLPRHPHHPWRGAWRRLSDNGQLRWSAGLGIGSVVFLAPMMGLVVPVAEGLRQRPAVAGAGLLIASFAVGELAAPWTVRFAQRRSTDLHAGEVAGALAGAMLIALGVFSALLHHRAELVAWVLIGVPFGVFRFAARALYIGSVADADGPDDAAANLAAADTAVLLMAPVGALLFGLSVNHGAVYAALLASGACAIAWNLVAIRTLRPSNERQA